MEIIIIGLGVLLVIVLVLRARMNDSVIEAIPHKRNKQVIDKASHAHGSTDPQQLSQSQLEDVVREMLQSGQKIEAIKILRAARNLGLKEAKDIIDAMSSGSPVQIPAALPKEDSTELRSVDGNDEEIKWLIKQGKKIEAIKVMREKTGLGLAEAKSAVEQIEKSLR